MEVILDTNFIISCVKKRIDFLDELQGLGFKISVPKEVLEEMKDLRKKVRHEARQAIDVAFELLDKRAIKTIKLGGKVDEKLIDKGKNGAYIATLDAAMKRAIPNRVVIDSARNGLLVERN